MTPMKRLDILLADDGSQHAMSAVELMGDFPESLRGRALILRAFHSGQVAAYPELEKAIERTANQLANMGFRVEKELRLDSPAELIIKRAQAKKPDLIIMGAKGLRSTIGILLGGVAQQVAEYACCPVLIVRAPYEGVRRILLVTDGSPTSQNAARYLAKFPLTEGAEAHVMHVLPPIQYPIMAEPYFGGWQTSYASLPSVEEEKTMRDRETKQGEALLKRTSNILLKQGIRPTLELARGDAATEIIEYVKTNGIDLIVAGSRGLSQFKSWWMGSVSRKLIHYAPCSVLIVKRREKGV